MSGGGEGSRYQTPAVARELYVPTLRGVLRRLGGQPVERAGGSELAQRRRHQDRIGVGVGALKLTKDVHGRTGRLQGLRSFPVADQGLGMLHERTDQHVTPCPVRGEESFRAILQDGMRQSPSPIRGATYTVCGDG